MAYDLVKPVKITHRISLYNICRHRYCSCDCPAAEHGNEGYDEKLSEVVSRILCARIRNVIEGGKEDVHGGSGLGSVAQIP